MGRLNRETFYLRCILPLPVVCLLLTASASRAQQATVPAPLPPASAEDVESRDDILDLDIEQLAKTPVVVPSMDVPVTSVAKEESTVGRSAAAVFVITPEMIRRSGATCIPEALRMVPGLDVARFNSNTWAISARGFNGIHANKLLVLIDGRTVYSPVFSGVYWDVQDVLLEDIDRIEVIRGPGGTLWGANAVNGVINVITKKAQDTQGAYVKIGGGTEEKFFDAARVGGRIGEDFYYRIYGKHFERGVFHDPDGPAYDAWRQGRCGFRGDWDVGGSESTTLTVQGDCYTGTDGMSQLHTLTVLPYSWLEKGKVHNSGQNVLARLRHVYNDDSDWSLQMYFDNFVRDQIINSERVRTFDVEFQYRFPLGERHNVVCGAGYRNVHCECPSTDPWTLGVQPPVWTLSYSNQFVQDEITLREDRLWLTVGCKAEQHPFTGLEYQPTARLLYMPDRKHSLWAAVSRAVRTPSVVDEGLFATSVFEFGGNPLFFRSLGNSGMRSEAMFAYEAGYRAQATKHFSYDVAAFYNVYHDLRTSVFSGSYMEFDPPPPHLVFEAELANGPTADAYGVELSSKWEVSDYWRIHAQYTFLQVLVHAEYPMGYGDGPHHQFYLRSSWDLREDLDFDMIFRYVDCLPEIQVPAYLSLDLRLAWRPTERLEFAAVGQNLLQAYHQEFNDLGGAPGWENTYVPRGVYGTAAWRY